MSPVSSLEVCVCQMDVDERALQAEGSSCGSSRGQAGAIFEALHRFVDIKQPSGREDN